MQEFKQKNIEKETFLTAFLLVQPDNTLTGTQRPTAVLFTIQKNSLFYCTKEFTEGEKNLAKLEKKTKVGERESEKILKYNP